MWDFLDVDAVALAAARENVPGARLIPSDGFDALEHERYDLIVSNPPFHEGKVETGRVVERLVRGAPDHLETDGSLVLVTQRRLPLAALLASTFKHGRGSARCQSPPSFGSARNSRERQGVHTSVAAEASPLDRH